MISLINISNIIGENSDLMTCCVSSHVNCWSFKKPINSNSMTSLTFQDYYDNDDGFNLWTFNSPQLMLNELQNTNTHLWEYEARTAPYRLTDFEDYNHYSQPMFEFTFTNLNTGTFGDTLRITCNTDIQNVVNNWTTPSQLKTSGDLVLLIFERGKQYDQSGMGTVYIYKVCQFINYDGEDIHFKIPAAGSIQTGDYTLVPCISTATGRFNDETFYSYNPNSETLYGQWFAFPPHSKLDFSITQTSPSHIDFFSLFNFNDFDYVNFDYTDYNYELRDITFNNNIVYYPYNTTRQFGVSIEYYYTNCAQPVLLGQFYRTFNYDNTNETLSVVYRGPITVINHLEEDKISIKQNISITSLGETQIQNNISRTLRK